MSSEKMPAGRKPPFSLESSATYEERARQNRAMADATELPHLKRKHLEVATRWMEFAARARAVERGRG